MLSGPECWAQFPGNESGEAAGNPDSHSLRGPHENCCAQGTARSDSCLSWTLIPPDSLGGGGGGGSSRCEYPQVL